MSARALAVLRAIAGFLRGYLGWSQLPRDSSQVRGALERRSGRRPSCC